jgi:hypothetical protein
VKLVRRTNHNSCDRLAVDDSTAKIPSNHFAYMNDNSGEYLGVNDSTADIPSNYFDA